MRHRPDLWRLLVGLVALAFAAVMALSGCGQEGT